ncbi:hypothetical protein Salat_1442600 [Sesamum alatum]|uniref:Uncharacterized protein n=1 Tax=Sesamum alatum TaxID=300844 RepID=A0AAE2CLX0_9LAMI|nr:hypothetical protein Salat_1442600 [Sesamum alatum]
MRHENDRYIVLKRLLDSTDGEEDNKQTKQRNRVEHGQAVLSITAVLLCFPDEDKIVFQTTTVLSSASDEDQVVFSNTTVYSENSEKGTETPKPATQVELKSLPSTLRYEFPEPNQRIL